MRSKESEVHRQEVWDEIEVSEENSYALVAAFDASRKVDSAN